jgi:hypothetical protein
MFADTTSVAETVATTNHSEVDERDWTATVVLPGNSAVEKQ